MWRCFQTLWNIVFKLSFWKAKKIVRGNINIFMNSIVITSFKAFWNYFLDTTMEILLDFDFLHIRYRTNLNANLIQDFLTISMFFNAVRCKENTWLDALHLIPPSLPQKLTSSGIPATGVCVASLVVWLNFAEKGSCLGNFGLNLTFRIWDANEGEKKHSPCTKTS